MARKNDPTLGHKILWRGYTILFNYNQAYELLIETDPERFHTNLRPDKTSVQ